MAFGLIGLANDVLIFFAILLYLTTSSLGDHVPSPQAPSGWTDAAVGLFLVPVLLVPMIAAYGIQRKPANWRRTTIIAAPFAWVVALATMFVFSF